MASSTLSPYKDTANTVVFKLVSSSADGATYQVEGRDIAAPFLVEIKRKFTSPSATTNDHVQVRVARVERNATTAKLATLQANLDISIPKDTSILTQTLQKELMAILCSLLRDATAIAATQANVTALIGGFDL